MVSPNIGHLYVTGRKCSPKYILKWKSKEPNSVYNIYYTTIFLITGEKKLHMYVCESKQSIMVKSVDSEVNQLWFESWLYHLITMWFCASVSTCVRWE